MSIIYLLKYLHNRKKDCKKKIVFDPSKGPLAGNPYLVDNFLPIEKET